MGRILPIRGRQRNSLSPYGMGMFFAEPAAAFNPEPQHELTATWEWADGSRPLRSRRKDTKTGRFRHPVPFASSRLRVRFLSHLNFCLTRSREGREVLPVNGVAVFHFHKTGGGLIPHARFAQDAKTARQQEPAFPLRASARKLPLPITQPRTDLEQRRRDAEANGLSLTVIKSPSGEPFQGFPNSLFLLFSASLPLCARSLLNGYG
jgi:hypothetical protein